MEKKERMLRRRFKEQQRLAKFVKDQEDIERGIRIMNQEAR